MKSHKDPVDFPADLDPDPKSRRQLLSKSLRKLSKPSTIFGTNTSHNINSPTKDNQAYEQIEDPRPVSLPDFYSAPSLANRSFYMASNLSNGKFHAIGYDSVSHDSKEPIHVKYLPQRTDSRHPSLGSASSNDNRYQSITESLIYNYAESPHAPPHLPPIDTKAQVDYAPSIASSGGHSASSLDPRGKNQADISSGLAEIGLGLAGFGLSTDDLTPPNLSSLLAKHGNGKQRLQSTQLSNQPTSSSVNSEGPSPGISISKTAPKDRSLPSNSTANSYQSFNTVVSHLDQMPDKKIVDVLFEKLLSTRFFPENSFKGVSTKRKWELLLSESETNSEFDLKNLYRSVSNTEINHPPDRQLFDKSNDESIWGDFNNPFTQLKTKTSFKVLKANVTLEPKSKKSLDSDMKSRKSTDSDSKSRGPADNDDADSNFTSILKKQRLKDGTPEWFVSRIMSNKLTLKEFKKLDKKLSDNKQEGWAQAFHQAQGETALSVILSRINKKSIKSNDEFDKEHLIVKCLRNILTEEQFEDEDGSSKNKSHVIKAIIFSLISPRLATRILVTEFLIFLAYEKNTDFIPVILDSLVVMQDFTNDFVRFQPWLSSFEYFIDQYFTKSGYLKVAGDTNFKNYSLTTLLLVNGIIRGTKDIKKRITLRREFNDSRLLKIFDKIKVINNERINAEIDNYEEYAEEDYTEFFNLGNQFRLSADDLETLSLDDLFAEIKKVYLEDSNQSDVLISIFQKFLMLKDSGRKDEEINKLLVLIESIMQHIIAESTMIGSDAFSVLNSSIQRLMDRLTTEDTARRAVLETKELSKTIKTLEESNKNLKLEASFGLNDTITNLKRQNQTSLHRISGQENQIESLKLQIKALKDERYELIKQVHNKPSNLDKLPEATEVSHRKSRPKIQGDIFNELETVYKSKSRDSVSSPPKMAHSPAKSFVNINEDEKCELKETSLQPIVPAPPPPPVPGFLSSSKPLVAAPPLPGFLSKPKTGEVGSINQPPPPPPPVPSFILGKAAGTAPAPIPPPPPPMPGFILSQTAAPIPVVAPAPPPPVPGFIQSQPVLPPPVARLALGELDSPSSILAPSTPPRVVRSFSGDAAITSDLTELKNDSQVSLHSQLRPKTKLKQMHWDKITNINKTFWNDIEHEELSDKLLAKGVLGEVEKAFVAKSSVIKFKKSLQTSEDTTTLSFLPRDLAQQFGINLHMFANLPVDKLILKILHCHSDILENISVLEFFNNDSLSEISDSLMRHFFPYSTDFTNPNSKPKKSPEELDRPDRIYLEIFNMRAYWKSRSRALLLTQTYQKDYLDLVQKLQVIDEANSSLKASSSLKYVLGIIRSVGNFMNDSSKQAMGFKLDTLQRLKFMKDETNTMTFLHYVEKVIRNEFPEFGSFVDELSALNHLNNIAIEQLENDCQEFGRVIDNVSSSLQKGNLSDSSSFHPEDRIVSKVTKPLENAKIKNGILQSHLKKTIEDHNTLMEYFGENHHDTQSRNLFFSKFSSFVTEFKKAHVENIQREEDQRAYEARKRLIEERAMRTTKGSLRKKAPGKESNAEGEENNTAEDEENTVQDEHDDLPEDEDNDDDGADSEANTSSAVIDTLLEKLKSSAPSSSSGSSRERGRRNRRSKALSFYSTMSLDDLLEQVSGDSLGTALSKQHTSYNEYESVNSLKRRLTTRKKQQSSSEASSVKGDQVMLRAQAMLNRLRNDSSELIDSEQTTPPDSSNGSDVYNT